MQKRKTLFAMAGIFAVLMVIYLALLFSNHISERRSAEARTPIVIFSSEKKDISELQVSYAGEQWRLIQKNGAWVLSDAEDFPVNQMYPDAMAIMLQSVKAKRFVVAADKATLGDYGLDPEMCRLVVGMTTGESVTFLFGKYYPSSGSYYVYDTESGNIYLVDESACNVFFYGLSELIKTDAVPPIPMDKVTGFSVENDGKVLDFRFFPNGSESEYTSYYQWFLQDKDGGLTPVDTRLTTAYLRRILTFSYVGCSDLTRDNAALQKRGLDHPSGSVTVFYDIGENKERFQIQFGDSEEERETRFATFDGSRMIGYVSLATASNLLDPDIFNYYLVPEVCLISLEETESMEVYLQDEIHEIRLDRTEGHDPKYIIDGKPVDSAAFEGFFQKIGKLTAERNIPDGSSVAEKSFLTIEFHRNTKTFKDMPLEFVMYDASFALVRFNGEERQLVNRREVEALSAAFTALLNN